MTDRFMGVWHSRIVVTMLLLAMAVAGLPTDANAQIQQLKLPFPAGGVQINFDETYFGTQPHPTNGAIAFDMVSTADFVNSEVLAMGDGEVRLACTHRSGSSILLFRADGYSGEFVYVHLEEATLPSWMSGDWTRVQQGDVVGRIFPNRINGVQGDSCLQFSTGPHLHLDLPQLNLVLDGVTFNEDFPNDLEQLISTNGLVAGPTSALCGGFDATIIGTTGNDVLVGTPGADVIAGLQGNDVIRGMGGDDVLCGGLGDDGIFGGEGFDVIYGAQGNDDIFGADENARTDTAGGRYFGGQGNDIILGTNRWDRMQGGPGSDRLYGYEGRDWMRGGSQNDRLEGGGAIDDLHGGNGNDLIFTGVGDIVRGGAGADECDLSGGQPETIISCSVSGVSS